MTTQQYFNRLALTHAVCLAQYGHQQGVDMIPLMMEQDCAYYFVISPQY